MSRAHVSRRTELCTARGTLSLDEPVIFGILNTTPDSFSDGGLHNTVEAAVARAAQMIEEGAHVIDVGGESTRPGATPVSVDEELARVVPVVAAIVAQFPSVFVSIDTVKSAVAHAAVDAGASIINDVSAFRVDPLMASVAAASGAAVVLMHSRGGVTDMASYAHASYSDVVSEVTDALCDVRSSANAAGIADERIILDPGLGFSKRTEQSIALLAHLERIVELGCAVMVGPSRKRFVGDVAGGLAVSDRVDGTLAACCIAYERGARLFRVHDVARTRRALAVSAAVARAQVAL